MKYYFVSGLPRSCSTLLVNILSQNPRFHTGGTSGIMDVMFGVRNQWDTLVEFKATPDEEAKRRVLKGVLDSYYSTDKPVVFDKCRGWLSMIEMIEYVLGEKVKILVPIRDVRDVLASFERIWRENNKDRNSTPQGANYFNFQSVQGRVNFWLQNDQPVGIALNRIVDALQRGYADRLLFVKAEDLTTRPDDVLKSIYSFLGEDFYQHDFNKVIQVNKEDDEVFGFKGLHTIREKVEPLKSYWKDVLGEGFEYLSKLNLSI